MPWTCSPFLSQSALTVPRSSISLDVWTENLNMKLPAPAYRQAGTPLGRDRHGGASSRFAHDENWIEDAKLSGTRGQARRCASQIIQTSQAIKNFVSNGIKLAQETTQKEMLINRGHVKEFR
jgi:hypothetical protein